MVAPSPRRALWRHAGWVATGIALLLVGGRAQGQSLTEALVTAYRSNPALLAERATVRAQDEGVAQALSGWRPTVTLNVNGGRQWYELDPDCQGGEHAV